LDKTKKISIILASLRGGGAERALLTLANNFVKQGFIVDLVLVKAEGPYLDEVSPQVNLVDLNLKRVFYAIPKLIKYIRTARPDSILTAMTHVNIACIIAKMIARVPLRTVISERNVLRSFINENSYRKYSLRSIVTFYLYGFADEIIAVSEGVKDDIVNKTLLKREDIEVIYNPVVTDLLLRKAEEDADHPWLTNGNLPVVLSAGRLSEQKDYSSLIRAFNIVKEIIPARLIILGEGIERNKLLNLIEDLDMEEIVSLPGFKTNPFAYMRKASLFVLSSAWEGLPNVLIQAMACGCPVVSTDCPTGPAEILDNGKYGPLVPVGDIDEMAKAIVEVLKNPIDGNILKRRADYFSEDRASKKYLSLLFK
jgi:glycosyltransferase involved in cell wall biosynthesis